MAMTITMGEAPEQMGSIGSQEAELVKEGEGALILETMMHASISLRGNLNAAIGFMLDMCAAIDRGDMAAVQDIKNDALALAATNTMLGMSTVRYPALDGKVGLPTMERLERIYGAQRVRMAAKAAKQA